MTTYTPYTPELDIKETTEISSSASYLDLLLSVTDRKLPLHLQQYTPSLQLMVVTSRNL